VTCREGELSEEEELKTLILIDISSEASQS